MDIVTNEKRGNGTGIEANSVESYRESIRKTLY